jgi:hypothetical protein
VAMLQAVAGLSPPYCTPPGHPGGRGRDDLPTRTVGNPEPQPIARKVGRGLRKVGRGLIIILIPQKVQCRYFQLIPTSTEGHTQISCWLTLTLFFRKYYHSIGQKQHPLGLSI